jgi:protein subunit release factor A
MFQFENFSEYTRTEVHKIIDQIEKRDSNCVTMLKELVRQFEIFKKAVSDFEVTAMQLSYT